MRDILLEDIPLDLFNAGRIRIQFNDILHLYRKSRFFDSRLAYQCTSRNGFRGVSDTQHSPFSLFRPRSVRAAADLMRDCRRSVTIKASCAKPPSV